MGAITDAARVYDNLIFDSRRWEQFDPRDGDVVVCTSYKAGTTWTQMVCLLLVHQAPKLPGTLGELSPWIDMKLEAMDQIAAKLEAQTHRRVVKTHTPLDGLPYHPNVTYLVCGRDPRDVFMSLQNHLANADMTQLIAMMEKQGIKVDPPPPLPDDIDARFALWMTQGTFPWERDGLPYWSHFHHTETFWAERKRPNIHFLHYADLKADLEGEMRRVARLLGIEVAEARWPALLRAATFEDMKANADRTAPDAHNHIWTSNSGFFHAGANEQWRGALSDQSLALYAAKSRDGYDPVMVDWLERGSRAVDDPRSL
jgi:hypothetical protein